jgi:hypothetical protein
MLHIVFICLMVLLSIVGVVVLGGLALFLWLMASPGNPFQ